MIKLLPFFSNNNYLVVSNNYYKPIAQMYKTAVLTTAKLQSCNWPVTVASSTLCSYMRSVHCIQVRM